MKRLILILTPTLFLLSFFINPKRIKAQTEEHVWKRVSQTYPQKIADYLKIEQTQISAIVGYGQITIEGYTSPEANIQLTSSQGNLGQHQTRADKKGFFRFTNIILPERPGELWLQHLDKQGLSGPPVAIPEPPPNLEKIEMIVLPPTLAQHNNSFRKNTNSFAFGQALPNSQVEVYFFEKENISWLKKLFLASPFAPKRAQAQQENQILIENKVSLKTDNQGRFSFSLPNQKNSSFRYYTGVTFADNYSPKSNTLSFRVLSSSEILYQQIIIFADKLLVLIFNLLKNLLFWIFLEVIILIILAKKYLVQKS